MAIIGNGTSFPAGTPQITLPTCGSGNVATITAPPGMGPYLWTGPGASTVTGQTAQTVSTSVTGNYTVTMNPPGACGPTVKQVSVVISPAPNLSIPSNTQTSCTSSVNGVSLQMASGTLGSGTPNYTVTFAPTAPTGTLGVTANTGTYTGLSVGVNTITITDGAGCTATQTINMASAPPIPSFSISAPGGFILGCAPPTLSLIAVNTNTAIANMNYLWSSTSTGTLAGATWIGTAPTGTNVLTVIGTDPISGCTATQTTQIVQNTAAPSVTVAPLTRTMTCGSACASFTAFTTTTLNITGIWTDGTAILSGPSATPLLLCAGAPGTYTAIFTNGINGCTTSSVVTVVSNSTVPTMTINSPNGFTLTCSQPSLGMNIQTNSSISPKTYSWTNVTTSVTTVPAAGGYTATVPGQYIACLNANSCVVCQTITVSQDTVRPLVSSFTNLPGNSYTINCAHPTAILTATSNPGLSITSYSWITPPNLTVSQNTINVGMANITSSTTPTNYTVLAVGANGCVGRQKIQMYKDIYVPPYTTVFTPNAISCGTPCVAFSPGASTSTVPITFTFTSPSPTFTSNLNGALFCNPGTYTMTYQSTLNGCTNTATTTVPLNVTPPATLAMPPVTMLCGQTTATITAGTSTTSTSYSYTWDGPATAGMSCPGGVGCYSTTTNMPGTYEVSILNTANGCLATNTIIVLAPSFPVSFAANPDNGYAPLGVTFNNTTPFSSSTGTVTTSWSYGNGIAVSTTSLANTYSATGFPSGSTTYQAAGTYTVLLMVTQNSGTTSCTGTATAVVHVELPSDLTVPNVFTPNGDGVNDNFTLLTTGLTDVTCTIFDRWGVKMYDVKSDKGNISWDGKNFGGKEVPEGTYFYILKATGADGKDKWTDKDGKEVKMEGTIRLYR